MKVELSPKVRRSEIDIFEPKQFFEQNFIFPKNSLKSLLFKNHDQPLRKRRRGNGSAAVPAFEFNTTVVLNHQ